MKVTRTKMPISAERRRQIREEKLQGIFVDRRKRGRDQEQEQEQEPGPSTSKRGRYGKRDFKVSDKYPVDITFWSDKWSEYIHHMTEDNYPGEKWDLRCLCGTKEKPHYHMLRHVPPDEWKAANSGNLGKGKFKIPDHKGRDCRTKFLCHHHFVNVVHYVRCHKVRRNKEHKHREFEPGMDEFPLCTGHRCKEFKEEMYLQMGLNNDSANCKHCLAGKDQKTRRWARIMAAQNVGSALAKARKEMWQRKNLKD